MPCDYSKYPEDWEEIRAQILQRAGNCCEGCGVPNHTYIWRDEKGQPHQVADYASGPGGIEEAEPRVVYIVLTVAHLDHNPLHNDPENLRAWCQKCHLAHDAKFHAAHARVTRARKKGQAFLPGLEG